MLCSVVCLLSTLISWSKCGFSSKTSYGKYHKLNKKDTLEVLPNGHRLHYFYGVFRHGNRYPSEKMIDKINSTLKLISRTPYDMQKLINMFALLSVDETSSVNGVGLFYMYHIGKRFAQRMPDIKQISAKNIRFTSTYTTRASLSMSAFGLGFVDGHWVRNQKVLPKNRLNELRFYDVCPVYQETKRMARMQVSKLLEHKLFQLVAERVSSRIYDSSSFKLSINDVLNLYDFCAMCLAHYHDKSPDCPCELFIGEDLEILEYANDMSLYYQKGDAYPVNIEMAVNHVRELLARVKLIADECVYSKRNTKVDAYFAHAETLLPIMGLFGMLRYSMNSSELDLELTPENFEKLKGDNRLFRGEKFVPLGANLVFAITCPSKIENKYVQFFKKYLPDTLNNKNNVPHVLAFLNEANVALKCELNKSMMKEGIYACSVENFVDTFTPKVKFENVCYPKCQGETCPAKSVTNNYGTALLL